MSDTRSFMALDWVRDEIEGTLKQAQEALEAYVEAGSDATQARQCLTRLHQVHGTLQMVELEGAAAFAAELEAVAQALMDGSLVEATVAQEALMEGILQLAAHLDRVQRGAPDELGPYRPLLNRLRVARGEDPEEGLPEGVDAEFVEAFIDANGPVKVRKLRASFQKAMLALLRKSQPAEKLWPFFDRLFTQLEATTPTSPLSRLWALAAASMERQDAGSDQAALVPLLRGLDAELRKLVQTPEQALDAPVPEALAEGLRQLLEPAAKSDSARVIALRSQWSAAVASGVDDFSRGADDATIATVAGALHEELAGIRDQLDLFARGSVKDPAELAGLVEVLQRVAGTLAVVGLDELQERISSQLDAVAAWVREGSASDDAVMDVASAVLEVDGRLMALAGITSENGELIPGSLSDTHAAVLREVRSSLEGVKQSIVDFISSEWEHEHLSPIAGTLAAVRSVLGLIPLERAGDLVECCRLYLQNEILADQSVPAWQRLDALADALTSIDYYLERMLADRSIPDPQLLDIAEESVTELGYPLSALAGGAPSLPLMRVDEDDRGDEQEGDLGEDFEALPTPVAEAGETPEFFDAGLFDAPSELTAPVEPDFDLGDDEDFEALPVAEPEAELDAGESSSSAWSPATEEDFDLDLHPGAAEDPAAPRSNDSASTIESRVVALATDDDADAPPIDDEIIEIFLEEVREVLENLDEHLPIWRAAPSDRDALGSVQRAFHTLKGSGRMVGATVIGELAWSVENMLNRVIDGTIEPSAAVLDLVQRAKSAVPALRQAFADRRDDDIDVQRLLENADILASGGDDEDLQAEEEDVDGPRQGLSASDEAGIDVDDSFEAAGDATVDRRDDDIDVPRLLENADILASGADDQDPQTEEEEEEEDVDGPRQSLSTSGEAALDADASFEAARDASDDVKDRAADEVEEAAPDLLEVFDQEAGEHLATLEAYLAERAHTGVCPPLEDEVRRALHTLKGSASMADLPGLSELAARLEQLVRGYLEIQRPADDALLSVLERGVERMQAVRGHLRQWGMEPVFAEADAAFVEAADLLSEQLLTEVSARESGAAAGATVGEIFRFDGMERIVEGGTVLDALAAGEDDPDGRATLGADLAGLGQRARAAGESAIAELAAALAAALEGATPPASAAPHAVRHGHEQLLAQLDALAAGLQVPAAGTVVAELEALAGAAETDADGSRVDDPSTLDLDPEMLDIFFEEADELLQEMESGLAQWPSPSAREQLMRALHTIKGGARMAGLDGLGGRVHDLETWVGEADEDDPSAPLRLQGELDELIDRVGRLRRGEAVGDASSPPAPPLEMVEAEAFGPDRGTEPVDSDDWPSAAAGPTETDFDLGGLAANELLPSPPAAAEQAEGPAAEPPPFATDLAGQEDTPVAGPGVAEAGAADADPEILALFVEEAGELTESLDATIGKWQREPDNELHLESLLRDLHTLKGGARMAGLSGIGDTAHQLEATLSSARGRAPAADFLTAMQEAVDALVGRVGRLDPTRASPPTVEAPWTADSEASVEAEAPLLPTKAPESVAARSESERSGADAPLKEAAQEMIRVAAGLLDDLVSLAGESSIMRGRIEQQVTDFGHALEEMAATIERIRQQVRRLELETEAQVLFRQEQSSKEGYEDFDPLEMDRYTQLQELARTLAESASDVTDLRQTLVDRARDTETLLLQQGRIHTELQEGLMRTRMVPFSRLLPRLQRIVRQVGRELSKPVNLQVLDAEGELDRNILERMIPPLEHMLRNAVDHGIESAERRIESGKPLAGTITLRLAREGGEILVEVADDGSGIDASVIRRKAIERGLLEADAEVSDQELLSFIMAPGFSTAQAVTQISGRGVGMDVVNSEVRQMGGRISIASQLGEGTRFTVRLPFTVSINRALMVVIGEDEYALPLNTIEGIVRVTPQELKQKYESDEPGFSYAGRNYALSYLGTWLGHAAPVREDVQSLPILMVRSGEQGRAVHVDGVAGSREIVVKSLGPQFAGVQGVSGATILGDGRVVVILDLPSLLRGAAELSLEQGRVAPARRDERATQVLVVDDSVTVRKVTTRLLERQGMAVTVAKDGVEAVSVLQDMRPDVMLLDIEMPRMDGFEVASHVRNEARLEGLPIIMITSRTGDKHRERAQTLGVNRFLGKPFQEAELLATIEELTRR